LWIGWGSDALMNFTEMFVSKNSPTNSIQGVLFTALGHVVVAGGGVSSCPLNQMSLQGESTMQPLNTLCFFMIAV